MFQFMCVWLGKCAPVSLASSTWGIDLVGSLFHIMVVRFKAHIICLFKVFLKCLSYVLLKNF